MSTPAASEPAASEPAASETGSTDDMRPHRRAEAIRAAKALSLGAFLGLILAWWARRARSSPT